MTENTNMRLIYSSIGILLLGSGMILHVMYTKYLTITSSMLDLSSRVHALEVNNVIYAESLQNQLQHLGNQSAETTRSLQELKSQVSADRRSQEEILTDAVANATPSVVSIVVSKNVPQLEIDYINPFGDDPYFRNFGFRIPVYRQKGTVEQTIGAGTGFIISRDGHIITNRHVVAETDAHFTILLWSGAQKTAKVIHRDNVQDIAILKMEGIYTPLTLGNSDTLRLGQSVVAIGNALGEFNNSVSMGIISGLNRTIEASDDSGNSERIDNVIQTDTAINRGNSGGPLLDLTGKAIGVNVATVLGSNNINFAIPVNVVKNIIQNVL